MKKIYEVYVTREGKTFKREVSLEVYEILYGHKRIMSNSEINRVWDKYDIKITHSGHYDLDEVIDRIENGLKLGYKFKSYLTTTAIRGYYNTLILGK